MAADYDISNDQIILDRVAGLHEMHRVVDSAIAVLAGPGRLGEQVLR
jgi:hypothetical protein